jgi:hypothetical protein
MTRLAALLLALCLCPVLARGDPLTSVVPGQTTKAQVLTLLGTPSRIVQFDDCGDAMPDEALETWEYPGGGARIHVEFDDHGIVHLIARIPDDSLTPTTAKTAPSPEMKGAPGMKDMTM